MILNVSFYETRELFDQDRERERFGFDGKFEKRELNPFAEVGVTDRLALLLNLFASRQEFSNDFNSSSNAGLGDSEVGFRYRVTRTDRPVIAAVQSMFKFATADTDGEIALGNGQFDADVRLVLGGSIGGGDRPPFWTVEGGYRWRADAPADEIKVEGTLGAYVHPRIMLMAQAATTTGMRNEDGVDQFNNPTLAPDYDLYRLQGSVVFRVAPRLRIQTAAFAHAWGRNTGAGQGALISAWIEY